MMANMERTVKIIKTADFPKILTTLSLEDVTELEYQLENMNSWIKMVSCHNQQKQLYSCSLCKIFYCTPRNIFNHLFGKKHLVKLEPLKSIRVAKKSSIKTAASNGSNAQQPNAKKGAAVKNPNIKTINTKNMLQVAGGAKSNAVIPVWMKKAQNSSNAVKYNAATKKWYVMKGNKMVFTTRPKTPVKTSKKVFLTKSQLAAKNQSSALLANIIKLEQGESTDNTSLNQTESMSTNPNEPDISGCVPLVEVKQESSADIVLNPLSQPNVVLNPLSKAAQEKQISCVPMSKLVIVIDDDDEDENTTLPESTTKDLNADENAEVADNPPNPNTPSMGNANNSIPRNDASAATFETSSNASDVLGLLGVEYVLKIVKSISDTQPIFLCSLCGITTDEFAMHNHLLSTTHRLNYCERHFPTAIRQYKQYVSEVPEHQVYNILTPILNKLAIAIETHHGRENSYLCYDYWFTKNKQSLITTVFNRRHASEVSGPTFTHVIDSNEVDELITNVTGNAYNKFTQRSSNMYPNHYAVNSYPRPPVVNTNYLHNIKTIDDETHKRMVANFLRDTRQSPQNRHRDDARNPKRSDRIRSRSPHQKRGRLNQWNLERRSLSPLRDGDIWQAYRHLVDQSVRNLNITFHEYYKDPEEHPQYKDEWQKFWKRRKDELIAAGINHRSYNYQNEWILFFNARLEELYNQDVENIKIKCRERLCLPMTNVELENPKYHVSNSENFLESETYEEPNPEPIAEDELVAISPRKAHYAYVNETDEINVIHVLRLLTALENFLGSLGPNITAMLAKALQISKLNPNNLNQIMLTSENCSILETAKEKFTGLIISKILDPNQERALKRAVNDTDELLELAAELKTEQPIRNMDQDQSSSKIDKSILAAKLASSLISRGKTSINQEKLKQIVEVYSLIEQKKVREMSSTSEAVNCVLNNNNSSSSLMSLQNKRENELPFLGRNQGNNMFSTQYQSQGSYNAHQGRDRQLYGNQQQFMTSDLNDMKTSSYYFSATMARTNNTTNLNNHGLNPGINGQQMQYNRGVDSGHFTKNLNPSNRYMGNPYSSGQTGNNTNSGWKPFNWK